MCMVTIWHIRDNGDEKVVSLPSCGNQCEHQVSCSAPSLVFTDMNLWMFEALACFYKDGNKLHNLFYDLYLSLNKKSLTFC